MITFRNVFAVSVFLFGTTYLWLTPSFVGKSAQGAVWTVVQVLAFAAIIGFAAAGWGILKATGWWEPVAIGSAIVGMASAIAYWIGVQNVADGFNAAAVQNIAIHFLGGAAVVAVLLVHSAEHWVVGRL